MKDTTTTLVTVCLLIWPLMSCAFRIQSKENKPNLSSLFHPTPSAVVHCGHTTPISRSRLWSSMMPGGNEDEEDSIPDPDGAQMAAQLFQMAQAKGVRLDEDDLMDDDDDDDTDYYAAQPQGDYDDDDDEEEMNFPQGAINAFLGYDTGNVGERLAGNVELTDDQLYSEVKERVLDTAGGFVDMVRGADEDYEDDEDTTTPKPYEPPTTVPDSSLTAGEVVLLVLEALKNNDNPTLNRGAEVLFGYSSSGSQIKNEEGLTPAEYASFLKETEYKVLFEHDRVVRKNFQIEVSC